MSKDIRKKKPLLKTTSRKLSASLSVLRHKVAGVESPVVKRQRTTAGLTSAGEIKRTRTRGIVKKPKRPKTAYNYFQLAIRDELWEELTPVINCPKDRVSHNEKVARVIGKRWKALSKKERTIYQAMADRDKRRYTKEHTAYVQSLRNCFEMKAIAEDTAVKKKVRRHQRKPTQKAMSKRENPEDPILDEKSSSSEAESVGGQDSEASTPTLNNGISKEDCETTTELNRLQRSLPVSLSYGSDSWKLSPQIGPIGMMKGADAGVFHVPEIPEFSDVLMEFGDLA